MRAILIPAIDPSNAESKHIEQKENTKKCCLFLSVDEDEVGTENKLVIVGGDNGIVSVIDLRMRQILRQTKFDSGVNCVKFASRDVFVVGCVDGSIYVVGVDDLKRRKVFHDSDSPVTSLSAMTKQKFGFFAGRQVRVGSKPTNR